MEKPSKNNVIIVANILILLYLKSDSATGYNHTSYVLFILAYLFIAASVVYIWRNTKYLKGYIIIFIIFAAVEAMEFYRHI